MGLVPSPSVLAVRNAVLSTVVEGAATAGTEKSRDNDGDLGLNDTGGEEPDDWSVQSWVQRLASGVFPASRCSGGLPGCGQRDWARDSTG